MDGVEGIGCRSEGRVGRGKMGGWGCRNVGMGREEGVEVRKVG